MHMTVGRLRTHLLLFCGHNGNWNTTLPVPGFGLIWTLHVVQYIKYVILLSNVGPPEAHQFRMWKSQREVQVYERKQQNEPACLSKCVDANWDVQVLDNWLVLGIQFIDNWLLHTEPRCTQICGVIHYCFSMLVLLRNFHMFYFQ